MIKKSLLAAAGFLCLYAFFIHFKPYTNSQHQWQSNINKAQGYLYSKHPVQNLIVGSSMANRMRIDSLPGFYNLCFDGLGVMDGLNIVRMKKELPRRIYLEMNIVHREEDKGFIASVRSPLLYGLREKFVILRDAHQPFGVAQLYLKAYLKKIPGREAAPARPADAAPVVVVTPPDSAPPMVAAPVSRPAPAPVPASGRMAGLSQSQKRVFEQMLRLQISQHSGVPDKRRLDACFRALKIAVQELTGRGVQVIFFEMPVNAKIVDLPLPTAIRQRFYQEFPVSRYYYLPSPPRSAYTTMDGVHLLESEVAPYTAHFRKHLPGIASDPAR